MDKIIEKYFSQSLNKEEEIELANLLKDEKNRKFFFEYTMERSLLIQVCGRMASVEKKMINKNENMNRLSHPSIEIKPHNLILDKNIIINRYFNIQKFLTTILCIASIFLTILVINRLAQINAPNMPKAIAKVVQLEGKVLVVRNDIEVLVKNQDLLREGDIVSTLGDGKLTFGFSDQTIVYIEENSSIKLMNDLINSQGKKILLNIGIIKSTTTKQPSKKPFLIETNNAIVSVVGTTFELKNELNRTYLEVSQGQVDLKSKNDQLAVSITPGFYGEVNQNGSAQKHLITDHWLSLRATRVNKGLNLMYSFSHSPNKTIKDVSFYEDNVDLKVHDTSIVRVMDKQGITIFVPTATGGMNNISTILISSKKKAIKLCEKVRQEKEFSFECWLKPSSRNNDFISSIFSTSLGSIQIGQDGKRFFMNIPSEYKTEEKNIIKSNDIDYSQQLLHLVFTYDKTGVASVYLNGQKQQEKNIGKNLGNMEHNESFFIANTLQNFNPWMGEILFLAFYHKGLKEHEVKEICEAPYLTD